MPFTVQAIHAHKYIVLNAENEKVAESPTREAAEAIAQLNNDIEQGKEIPEPKQVPV